MHSHAKPFTNEPDIDDFKHQTHQLQVVQLSLFQHQLVENMSNRSTTSRFWLPGEQTVFWKQHDGSF